MPEECIAKIGNGFTFLKTYKPDLAGKENEFSYVFSKNTNYMLLICGKNNNAQNIIATIFDSSKKEIASNYDKKNDRFYPAFVYNCTVTGIYYMKFTFKERIECCNGILAFKK